MRTSTSNVVTDNPNFRVKWYKFLKLGDLNEFLSNLGMIYDIFPLYNYIIKIVKNFKSKLNNFPKKKKKKQAI